MRAVDAPGGERPAYAAYALSETVELVSYRADSGFTLTVALNFADHRMVGIASNSEQWFPARGHISDGGWVAASAAVRRSVRTTRRGVSI